MKAPHHWIREEFYGNPNRAVRCLNLAFGFGVGLLTRSPGLGAAVALGGGRIWDRFSPRLVITDQRLGPVILRVPFREPAKSKQVWLTFDDGPGPETGVILDILREHGAPATFFVIGKKVAEFPDLPALAGRFASAGHVVGHHSWSHPSFLGLRSQEAWEELVRTDSLLRETFSQSWLPLFRPPFGYRTEDLFTHLQTLGLHTVGWSLNSLDFLSGSSEDLVRRVVEKTEPRTILLFHDGPEGRARTVEALPRILTELQARGYTFSVPCREDFSDE